MAMSRPQHQFEETFSALAESPGTSLRIPREAGFSRKQVALAFQQSFELIGGVTRMAAWANDNPSKFYALYSRLLPSPTLQDLEDTGLITIMHSIPRTKLDATTIDEEGHIVEDSNA